MACKLPPKFQKIWDYIRETKQDVVTEYEKKVWAYVESIESGSRMSGKCEKGAVTRFRSDLEKAEKDDSEFYFDKNYAIYACKFFSFMKITQGDKAGEEFKLYPWQAFVVWNLFGWRRRETGHRRFRQALVQVARGNGKTPFGAGLLLLSGGFMPDTDPRANNYIAATKRDQAKIAYGDIEAILKECPQLGELTTNKYFTVTVKENGCTFQALSSDGATADGLRIMTVLKDEYHAWDNTRSINQFEGRLKTALAKFKNSLSLTITTAGNEMSTKWIAYDTLARNVLDPESVIEMETMFAFICELDEEDDLFDIKNYEKSNPMLEFDIVDDQIIKDYIVSAKLDNNAKQELDRFYANRKVHSSSKPFTVEIWSQGNRTPPELGRHPPCGGLDLGSRDDLAALAAVWRIDQMEEDAEPLFVFDVDIWLPKGGTRNILEDPWKTWIELGFITVTDSEWTDFNFIFRRIQERKEEHGWSTIAVDQWNGRQIAIDMENDGIKTEMFDQSYRKYNEPCNELEKAAMEGRIFHGGNPVLEWCALNYITASNVDGHKRPDKEMSEEKIDPLVAILMGMSESMFGEKPFVSKYEKDEVAVWGVDEKGEVDLFDLEENPDEEPTEEAKTTADPFLDYYA